VGEADEPRRTSTAEEEDTELLVDARLRSPAAPLSDRELRLKLMLDSFLNLPAKREAAEVEESADCLLGKNKTIGLTPYSTSSLITIIYINNIILNYNKLMTSSTYFNLK